MEYFPTLRPAAPPQAFPELNEREGDVLGLLAEGCKNAEIAERLVVSPKTARDHIPSILGKLQVANRTQPGLANAEDGLGWRDGKLPGEP